MIEKLQPTLSPGNRFDCPTGKRALRPIGTVFEYVFPPSQQSTDSRAHRATYRVINHIYVATETGGERLTEAIACIGYTACD